MITDFSYFSYNLPHIKSSSALKTRKNKMLLYLNVNPNPLFKGSKLLLLQLVVQIVKHGRYIVHQFMHGFCREEGTAVYK